MAYDTVLADRIRELLSAEPGIDEKPMFGGLAFLVGGHMAVAVSGQGGLLVRVPRDDTAALLAREHVSPMVMAGREASGWLRVACRAGAGVPGPRPARRGGQLRPTPHAPRVGS